MLHIPESKVRASIDITADSDIDEWAQQGWIDLRVKNMEIWIKRAQTMMSTQENSYIEGSSSYARHIYTSKYLV